MDRIAVLGDYESIYGFAALGLETFPVSGEEEGKRVFRELTGGNYAAVYVTEALASAMEEELAACRERFLPAVILIPGVTGNTGAGVANVKKSVEQAVGSDILF